MFKGTKWRIGLALYLVAMNALLIFFIHSISYIDRSLAVSYEVGVYEHLKVWMTYVLLGNAYILLLPIMLAAILLSLRLAAKLLIRLAKSPCTTETGTK